MAYQCDVCGKAMSRPWNHREMHRTSQFGWNPQVGDRVEGVARHGGTGHFGTVEKKRRDGFVVRWDKTGKTSVHQSYGFRKVEQ